MRLLGLGMGKSKGPSAAKKAAVASSAKQGGRGFSSILALGGFGLILVLALPYIYRETLPPPKPSVETGAPAQKKDAADDTACIDLHEMCEAWHKAGLCRKKGHVCKRTCGKCPNVAGRNPRVPRESRCRRDNLTAAVPEGRLDELFQTSIDSFPEYSPVVLSRSPWVVQYHNFITNEEAEAFQDVCKESFERSLAGDQLNPVRTSFQCWCNFPKCFANEHVHRVVRRINQLTGTPFDNGEDLQVVRYEPGQFYKRHHDQNTALWTPQGPRVLTFFMYLNDPEAGGETAFPSIGEGGITVSPKKGSAILWPSTFNDQPMSAGALPPVDRLPTCQSTELIPSRAPSSLPPGFVLWSGCGRGGEAGGETGGETGRW